MEIYLQQKAPFHTVFLASFISFHSEMSIAVKGASYIVQIMHVTFDP